MAAARAIGRGIYVVVAAIVRVALFLVIVAVGLTLFVGFWFGLNWLLHAAGIPIRIFPRL